jgi:hypothetical protein
MATIPGVTGEADWLPGWSTLERSSTAKYFGFWIFDFGLRYEQNFL